MHVHIMNEALSMTVVVPANDGDRVPVNVAILLTQTVDSHTVQCILYLEPQHLPVAVH